MSVTVTGGDLISQTAMAAMTVRFIVTRFTVCMAYSSIIARAAVITSLTCMHAI